jgi:hypothetical protein
MHPALYDPNLDVFVRRRLGPTTYPILVESIHFSAEGNFPD